MRIKNEAQKEWYDAAEIHLTKSPELLMLPCDGFFFVLSRLAYRAVHVRRRTNTTARERKKNILEPLHVRGFLRCFSKPRKL